MDIQLKSRVYISICLKKEIEDAKWVQILIRNLAESGFDANPVFEETTLKGIKENVFGQLKQSDYFILIDFPREQLVMDNDFRGSLFGNQELAIASYLGLKTLVFQQKGIKKFDGMIKSLEIPPVVFKKTPELPDLIIKKIKETGWKNSWKNGIHLNNSQLSQTIGNIQLKKADGSIVQSKVTNYQIKVENLNPHQPAFNCIGYIQSIKNLKTKELVPLKSCELKWSGFTLPDASIMPESYRELEALYQVHERPDQILFKTFSDTNAGITVSPGNSEYEITYLVVSRNYAAVSASLILKPGKSPLETKILPIN